MIKDKIDRINGLIADVDYRYHGFLTGSLGLLYYYYHAGRVLNDKKLLARAGTMLEKVFDDMNGLDGCLLGAAYSEGGAGFGYVVNYLQEQGFIDFDSNEGLAGLDVYLYENAVEEIEADHIDFLHGAMGIIMYFSEREQTSAINSYLNNLVERIADKAVYTESGVWFKNIAPEDRGKPEEINFSLSHGLCGTLLVLLKAYPHIKNKDKIEQVVREGIRFMIRHELPVDFEHDEFSFFPNRFKKEDTEITRNARLAWCYGDLNAVLVFYRAGRLFGDARYTAIADRIGLKTTERKTLASTLSSGIHFCHGTAGLAQFYKALYAETFNYQYHVAYEHWIDQTLALIEEDAAANKYARTPGSLLEGWPGAGMVLVEYLGNEKMCWARGFLL